MTVLVTDVSRRTALVALAPWLALSIKAKRAGGVIEPVLGVTRSQLAVRVVFTRRKYTSVAGFIADVSCGALVCRITAWAIGMIEVRNFKILLRRGFFAPGTQA